MGIGARGSRAPGFVYYNPRFFLFLSHIPTSRGPTSFFVPDLPRVPGVPEDPPWGLRLSFPSHFCLHFARLAHPS